MSGRVADSDAIKSGETVDFDLMNLTENYGEGANAMKISAEHKVRGRGRPRVKDEDEMSLSELEEMEEREKGKKAPERSGMSSEMSRFLATLPARERERMRRQRQLFKTSKRKGKVEIAKHREGERHDYPAMEAQELRERVLGASLFPNLYNKHNLLVSM